MKRPLLADVRPIHPTLRHPLTGQPLKALGHTKSGRIIWPVLGGSQPLGEPAPAPAAPAPAAPPVPAPPVPPAPPAPAPVPAPPAVPPVPAVPAAPASGPNGFPENTPVAEMSADQQAAYWKHHARQHEARWKAMGDYDQLKAQAAKLAELEQANMTDQQKAVAEAEQRGRQAALAESGGKLVEQFFRAVLNGRKNDDEIAALIAPLDRKQFLAADGLSVDADKVAAFANVVAPAQPVAPAAVEQPSAAPAAPAAPAPVVQPATGAQPRKVPDMGQGPTDPVRPTGLAAGKAIAEARYGKKNQPTAA